MDHTTRYTAVPNVTGTQLVAAPLKLRPYGAIEIRLLLLLLLSDVMQTTAAKHTVIATQTENVCSKNAPVISVT